jgi:hypothetical protein
MSCAKQDNNSKLHEKGFQVTGFILCSKKTLRRHMLSEEEPDDDGAGGEI